MRTFRINTERSDESIILNDTIVQNSNSMRGSICMPFGPMLYFDYRLFYRIVIRISPINIFTKYFQKTI